MNWVLVVVALALTATVALALTRRNAARQDPVSSPSVESTPVSDSVMEELSNVPAETWSRVGTAGAARPTFVGDSDMVGTKPVVLYIGAEYCPYCAAARWSIITSLARFGTFSGLSLGASSSLDVFPSTPTFSFYGSHYTSPYIEVQTVELASSVLLPNRRYQRLETPTAEQEALIRKYDAPPYVAKAETGGIPFLLVGGRYMWSGSPFSPELLAGQTQAAIAATLSKGTDTAARAILANGNQITATICAMDGGQPTEVCSDPAIRQAIEALPRKRP